MRPVSVHIVSCPLPAPSQSKGACPERVEGSVVRCTGLSALLALPGPGATRATPFDLLQMWRKFLL